MAGFKGKYEYTIDAKGRLNLPAKLKKYVSPEANETFTLTRGHEGCLYIYPQDIWVEIEKDFSTRLNVHNEEDRLLLRTVLMNSHELTLDRQSRLSIPQSMLDLARITSNVVVIGALDKIEVWSPEILDAYLGRFRDQSYESVSAKVLGGMRREQ